MIETTALNLRAAMRAVAPALVSRGSVPILNCVRIAGDTIFATDLDTEIKAKIPVFSAEDTDVVMDWRGFSGLVKHVPRDETVNISVQKSKDGASVKIGFNGSEYTVASLPPEDWPSVLAGEISAQAHAANNNVAAAMRAVRFAASYEETRYYLNGVSFAMRDGKQYAVATNGHMLACREVETPVDFLTGAIVHHKGVRALLSPGMEPQSLAVIGSGKALLAEMPGTSILTRLIDGKFFDVWRVCPAGEKLAFRVDRLKLRQAIQRLRGAVSIGPVSPRAVRFDFGEGELVASIKSADGFSGVERLPAETGFSGVVGYNSAYVMQLLDAFSDQEMFQLHQGAGQDGQGIAGNPAIVGEPDSAFFAIIMPMRI